MNGSVRDVRSLRKTERPELAKQLVEQLLIDARSRLHKWRALTKQPAQIDTGYVAQHLVSITTGIPGGGFRGKGDDLADGSEVKSANFLDSFDARGAVSPRWNFTIKQESEMRIYLAAPKLYLASIDLPPGQAEVVDDFERRCVKQVLEHIKVPETLHKRFLRSFSRLPLFLTEAKDVQKKLRACIALWCSEDPLPHPDEAASLLLSQAEQAMHETSEKRLQLTNACRIRIWQLEPSSHQDFKARFEQWIELKAKPKFREPSRSGKRQDANFQLFPPRFGTDETYGRHGSKRGGELPPVHIQLEGVPGSRLLLKVVRDEQGNYVFG